MTRSLNENPQFRDAPQVYLTHRGAAWRSRGERANGIHGNIGVLLAEEAAVWSCVWRAKMMQAQAQQQQMPQAAGAGTSLQSLMLMRLLVPVCIHGNFLERYTNLGCSCTNPAVPTSSVMGWYNSSCTATQVFSCPRSVPRHNNIKTRPMSTQRAAMPSMCCWRVVLGLVVVTAQYEIGPRQEHQEQRPLDRSWADDIDTQSVEVSHCAHTIYNRTWIIRNIVHAIRSFLSHLQYPPRAISNALRRNL